MMKNESWELRDNARTDDAVFAVQDGELTG